MALSRRFLGIGQTGIVLLAGLMLTFAITLLGFGLFHLAVLESRLVLSTEAEYGAFETAQAGIERALHLLFLDYCSSNPACTSPPADPSWVDGTPAQSTAMTEFADFPGLGTPQSFGAGTYTVRLKNLTQAEASGLGLICNVGPSNLCKDLLFVRSTGAFTKGVAESSSRTIQLIAQANDINPFEGFLSGGAAGAAIEGNARIAASIHVVGCADLNDSCARVVFSGTAGQRNNYNDMPISLQQRVPRLALVCPPGNINCPDSAKLESLGASLQIAWPRTVASMELSGTAAMGTKNTTTNPHTGKSGKPSLDLVRIGDGCNAVDCSDAVAGNQGAKNIHADSAIKEYRPYPAPLFPVLDQAVTVKGEPYPKYADCPSAGNCNSGATSDFFISHAFKITTSTLVDPTSPNFCLPGGPCNLFNILTGGAAGAGTPAERWDDTTPSFTKTFVCGTNCNDGLTAGVNRVNGAIGDTANLAIQPPAFQLAWDQSGQRLTINQCTSTTGTPPVCGAGVISPLSHATEPVLPILIYVDGPIKVCEGCNNKTFNYSGQAIFLANGNTSADPDIIIDPSLLTSLDACPGGTSECSFPRRNLLTFLTPGDMSMGLTSNREMMGFFYAGGTWTTSKQTKIVGGVTAKAFNMGSNVPNFFQVPRVISLLPEILFPLTAPTWRVNTLRWKECGGSLPPGPC